MFVDRNLHLGDINKASGESWQGLSHEEKEVYIKRADEESTSSCSSVGLKQILSQLSKLVCHIAIAMYTWCQIYVAEVEVEFNLQTICNKIVCRFET